MISAWGWLLQDDNDHSGPLHSTLHLISFTECLCLVLIIDYLLLTLVWTRWLVPHHLSGSLWYSSCNSIYISHKLCKLIRFQFNIKFSLSLNQPIIGQYFGINQSQFTWYKLLVWPDPPVKQGCLDHHEQPSIKMYYHNSINFGVYLTFCEAEVVQDHRHVTQLTCICEQWDSPWL